MHATTASIPSLLSSSSTKEELASPHPPSTPQFVYNSSSNFLFNIICLGIATAGIGTIYSIAALILNRVYKPVLPTLPKIPRIFMYTLIAYYFLHTIAKHLAHPAMRLVPFMTHPSIGALPPLDINSKRKDFLPSQEGIPEGDKKKLKRCSIRVNGMLIDILIVYTENNLHKKRWMLCSNGNAEYFETKGDSAEIKLADELEYNCVFYNPPAVGCSEGKWSLAKHDMVAAHQGVHTFVQKRFEPDLLVDHGYSIGGGMQGESIKNLQETLNTLFVKYMSFSSVNEVMAEPFSSLARFLNWNYSSIKSSKTLKQPEVIIQQGLKKVCCVMQNKEELAKTDGVISREASLTFALWDEHQLDPNKAFLLVPNNHITPPNDDTVKHIAETIKNLASKISKPNHSDT